MLHCDSSMKNNNNKKVEDSNRSSSLPESFHSATPLQVELNTIASSFGCLSSKVTSMHKHLNSVVTNPTNSSNPNPNASYTTPFDEFSSAYKLPDNNAAEGIAQALALAHSEYKRQRGQMIQSNTDDKKIQYPNIESVIVMVVQPGETNSCDQVSMNTFSF